QFTKLTWMPRDVSRIRYGAFGYLIKASTICFQSRNLKLIGIGNCCSKIRDGNLCCLLSKKAMKTLRVIFGILLCTNFFVFTGCAKSKENPTVPGKEQNEANYQVKIRNTADGIWKELVVERAKVNNKNRIGYCNFVTFDNDFAAPIEVEVTPLHKPSGSPRIRPASYEILPSTEDDRIRFVLDKPTKLSLEIDGDIVENLFVFANP